MAAREMGVPAFGTDVNPLACLVTQTKLEPFPDAISEVGDALRTVRLDAGRITDAETARFQDPSFDYARKWFNEPSLQQLLRVALAVARLDANDRVVRVLLVALAGIVRDVAEVDARCTHHLVRKRKAFVDALPLLESRAIAIAEATSELRPTQPEVTVEVVQASCFEAAPKSPSLAIVHPPYLGVIHYHLIHRLSTEILRFVASDAKLSVLSGLTFDPDVIRIEDASTDNGSRYGGFLEALTARLSLVLPDNARAVVILGDARHKGLLRHPFTDVVAMMENSGMALEENFIWLLQNNGGMHVLRRGHHIDHNYVMVFRKP